MLVRSMDVSNYQPRNLSNLIMEHEPEHVIVRLFLPEETPDQAISIAQLHSTVDNGCSPGGYHWCYRDLDPIKSAQDALALFHLASVGKLPVLWHDIEPYNYTIPDANWLRTSFNYCVAQGVRPGIYTGKWVWDAYFKNVTEFAHLPHLLAYYDYDPDIDPIDLGFVYTLAGQQFTDIPVDLSMIEKEYTEAEMALTPEEKEIIRNVVGPLRTWATAAMKRADATEQIGAGEPWQFQDQFTRRLQTELTDYADRLDGLIG
jgi:hypothetical protein